MHREPKLFMALLGATPPGRRIEQHDVFFGIADCFEALAPQMVAAWPEASGKIHIDSWREVTIVDGFKVEIATDGPKQDERLFFLNLGGYKPDDPEEYHYKMLVVATTMAQAVAKAKQTAFYRHTGFAGAVSHIDDRFAIDVDDVHLVQDLLSQPYIICLRPTLDMENDALHIGYLKIDKLLNAL